MSDILMPISARERGGGQLQGRNEISFVRLKKGPKRGDLMVIIIPMAQTGTRKGHENCKKAWRGGGSLHSFAGGYPNTD